MRLLPDGGTHRRIDLLPEPGSGGLPCGADVLAAVEARLCRAGIASLAEVAAIAVQASEDVGLEGLRVIREGGRLHLGLTDASDSARWIFEELWDQGVAPGQVLVVADEMGPRRGVPAAGSLMLRSPGAAGAAAVSVGREPGGPPAGVLPHPGGPAAFRTLLDDQRRRRRRGDVPGVAPPPGWSVEVTGVDDDRESVHEAVLAIADGCVGTSGSPLLPHAAAAPRVLAAGVYEGVGPEEHLAPLPVWHRLCAPAGAAGTLRRVLDLHAGLLRHEGDVGGEPYEALLLSSLARPGVCALRAAGPAPSLDAGPALQAAAEGSPSIITTRGAVSAATAGPAGAPVGAVAAQRVRRGPVGRLGVERLAVYAPGPRTRAAQGFRAAGRAGFDRLLREHRQAWASRWRDADILVENDPRLQRDVRFALFHLMASVADRGEAAVGARGLSGPGYRGHVFWDADVFVLPFLAATHPAAARAMLEYRARRLGAALARARALGREGARFPWEAASDGREVTPREMTDAVGRRVVIRTGDLEEHIVADVAWAAAVYAGWSGDDEFRRRTGMRLLVETARYWASRITVDPDGSGHIRGVIGPDEYHEDVDDNAYTNVMARWNLRRAATEAAAVVDAPELARWRGLADALVDGYDPHTRRYEQFTGFWGLEPVVITELVARRPVAADLVLGQARLQHAQVVKQADVLMLHHLLPGEVAPGSLEPNLAFYEPRTAHGSSLSPAVHAGLLARAGHHAQALEALRLAARIDLDDLAASTGSGLHVATMGGLWQALVMGMAGVRVDDGVLRVDPHMPPALGTLRISLRYRGSRVRVEVEGDRAEASADPQVPVVVGDAEGGRPARVA